MVEEATTLSINCHGFRYFAKQRPQKNAALTFQITDNKEDNKATPRAYPGRVAWVRKSHRLEGLYLVGVELGIPLNIWDMDEVPEDWAAFSPPKKEDPAAFLADIDRILHTVQTTSYYQLLNVEPNAPRSEVKSHFYQLARRFHPDHHMDHPEWTPRLLALMDGLTAAYKTLSDDKTKKEYDSFLTSESHDVSSRFPETDAGLFGEERKNVWRRKTLPGAFCGCIAQLRVSRILQAIGPCWGGVCPPFPNTGGRRSSNLSWRFSWIRAISPRTSTMVNCLRVEGALAGAVPLSSRIGARCQSLGSARAVEPPGCERTARLFENFPPGPADGPPLSSDR